ncbi:hypothetical protein [Sutterella megalosphaeroides]|uniref:Secreted protein n=1 Tax=Sutterella megalosphaeroides TaxID=2494234 RepID=A0A2Z6IAS9_9BURK|nr:hypothetical protein [Sutterella megalosphaeroides]BBF23635.1 hypothetical protein SUTMEG_15260 [Sutterella megalosphaeroides]
MTSRTSKHAAATLVALGLALAAQTATAQTITIDDEALARAMTTGVLWESELISRSPTFKAPLFDALGSTGGGIGQGSDKPVSAPIDLGHGLQLAVTGHLDLDTFSAVSVSLGKAETDMPHENPWGAVTSKNIRNYPAYVEIVKVAELFNYAQFNANVRVQLVCKEGPCSKETIRKLVETRQVSTPGLQLTVMVGNLLNLIVNILEVRSGDPVLLPPTDFVFGEDCKLSLSTKVVQFKTLDALNFAPQEMVVDSRETTLTYGCGRWAAQSAVNVTLRPTDGTYPGTNEAKFRDYEDLSLVYKFGSTPPDFCSDGEAWNVPREAGALDSDGRLTMPLVWGLCQRGTARRAGDYATTVEITAEFQ